MKYIEVKETDGTHTFINVDTICSVESTRQDLTKIMLTNNSTATVSMSIQDVMNLIEKSAFYTGGEL